VRGLSPDCGQARFIAFAALNNQNIIIIQSKNAPNP
jgi:hypothetical protein